MTLTFAPGETNAHIESFSPSIALFWLKADMGVSNTRLAHKMPNTVFGVIPVGARNTAIPLANIAGVSVSTSVSGGRLGFGLLTSFIALAATVEGSVAGLFWLLFGLLMIFNAFKATLDVSNNGGGVTSVDVSVLERAKLEAFRAEVDQRLFADHSQLRHVESMGVQQDHLTATLLNTQLTALQTTPQPVGASTAPEPNQISS